jgi:phosphotransferase system enzyme I (PtsI)
MSESPFTVEKIWTGAPVSDGVAHAVVHVLKDHFDEPDEDSISPKWWPARWRGCTRRWR